MRYTISRRKTVYLAIIAVLILLLILQQFGGREGVPRIPAVEEEVDALVIDAGVEAISIARSGEEWFIGEEGFPGDGDRINGLVEKISDLRFLEEVSRTDYFEPYQLDSEAAIRVTIRSSGVTLRRVLIGKASSSGRQTYLRFDGEERVYLVAGNLRRDFEIDAESLRNKEILRLDEGAVTRISLRERETAGEELIRTEEGWRGSGEQPLDQRKIADFLRNFAPLLAAGFPDGEILVAEPLFSVRFETGGGERTVEILTQDEDDRYYARSSASPYLFSLSAFKGEQLMKNLDDFLLEED